MKQRQDPKERQQQ